MKTLVETPALAEARRVKLVLRKYAHACRETRKRWLALREKTRIAIQIGAGADFELVAQLTTELWTAEQNLADAAVLWRENLAAREALPVAERWNLVDMERWAQAQPLV